MMNYNKIQDLLTKNGISISKACTKIGRTDTWFHYARKKDTMTVKDLTVLLKLCNISLVEFFGGEKQEINEPLPTYGEDLIEVLKENIILKDKEIATWKAKCKELEQNSGTKAV